MATSTIDATVGGVSSNAYVTLAEADAYHDDRPAADTTWSAATDDNKNKAILWATKLMDSLFEWTGFVTDYDQALLWPRSGMNKRNGDSVENDVLPQELKDATAEYARQLLADAGKTDDSDIEVQDIRRLKAGSVELEFGSAASAKAVPDAIVYLIPDDWYVHVRGRPSMTRSLVRA